jgi:hypothetical protein
MEPYQIYVGVYIALFLISRFFQGDDYGDIESEEKSILDERVILNSALGTLCQLED